MAVRIERQGEVTVVTIDRPQVRNAVDRPLAAALVAAFEEFDADEGAQVAVLTGAGGTFSSGPDLKAVGTEGARYRLHHPDGPGPMGPTRFTLSKPVIAAVEGHAVAGGLELALWCDLRVASTTAVFGVFSRRWGVPLMDGGTVRLPRLIGQGRALDMILTGRAVDAEEAHRIGLADRLVPAGTALAEAIALARHMASFPRACMRADRASTLRQWSMDLPAALVAEGMRGERVLYQEGISGAARFAAGEGRHGSMPPRREG